MILVKARFGDELLDIREFIRPNSYAVQKAWANLQDKSIFGAWDFVCREIAYPITAHGVYDDTHVLSAFIYTDIPFFGNFYRVNKSTQDFWEFPSETLTFKIADCEGTSILLCSMLRQILNEQEVCVAIGQVQGYGHAWVEARGQILETTLSAATDKTPSASVYMPVARFNDYTASGSLISSKGDKRKLISSIWGLDVK